jgi:hypothetical protein
MRDALQFTCNRIVSTIDGSLGENTNLCLARTVARLKEENASLLEQIKDSEDDAFERDFID